MPQESKENMSQVLERLTNNFSNPQLLIQEILGKTEGYSGFQLVLVGKIVQNILESRSGNSNIVEFYSLPQKRDRAKTLQNSTVSQPVPIVQIAPLIRFFGNNCPVSGRITGEARFFKSGSL